MKNKGIVKAVMGVLLLIITVSGITYAAFAWASDPNNGFIDGTTECFVLDYTKGTDIMGANLDLGTTYTDGLSTTVKAKLSDDCNVKTAVGTLYLNIDDITSDYLINNKIIRYQVLEDEVEVSSGKVEEKGITNIYEDIEVTSIEKTFTVYIWMSMEDANDNNVSDIMSSSFSGAIGMKAESRG